MRRRQNAATLEANGQAVLFAPLPVALVPPKRDTAAFVSGSATSREAAKSLRDHLARLQFVVLDFIRLQGDVGATDDEIEQHLHLRHQTASARRRELVLKDYIVDSERRRETRSGRRATVWVLKRS